MTVDPHGTPHHAHTIRVPFSHMTLKLPSAAHQLLGTVRHQQTPLLILRQQLQVLPYVPNLPPLIGPPYLSLNSPDYLLRNPSVDVQVGQEKMY